MYALGDPAPLNGDAIERLAVAAVEEYVEDGEPWTQADIDGLQAGQTLSAINSGEARVTQLWVVVKIAKPFLDLDYYYNGAGDVTRLATVRSASSWTETFAYDGQDRLAKWTASGANAFSQQFAYTAAGDRSSMVEDGSTWTYVYTGDHRLRYYTKTGFMGQLTYDPSGNLVTRTVTTGSTTTYTYAYDAEDRLTTVKKDGATIGSYSYDGLGRRIKVVEGATTSGARAGSPSARRRGLGPCGSFGGSGMTAGRRNTGTAYGGPPNGRTPP